MRAISTLLKSIPDRLSLSARLMLGSGAALTIAAAVLLYSLIVDDVVKGRRELAEKLRYEIAALMPAVSESAIVGDYSLIQQILKVRVDQPDIGKLSWIDTRDNAISVISPPDAYEAPAWFVRWVAIQPVESRAEVEVGGVRYGAIVLQTDPVRIVNDIWRQSIEMMQLLVFILGVLFALTLWIAANGLRPLYALASSAARFGRGDYSVRIEPHGPPEMVNTIQAFNSMAESIARDIAERKQAREILFAEKERAQVTLASIADAVVTTDTQGRIDYLNPVAEKLTGWQGREAAGMPLSAVFRVVDEATGESLEDPVQTVLRCGRSMETKTQTVLASRGGQHCPIEHTAAPIRNREGEIVGVVLVFRDVGESRKLAHQLSWQACHDSLTGLVNRREFERRLALLVEESNSGGAAHALLYLDLDQFKVVNDTCGHMAGDELLRQLSCTLQARIRESDTLARLGGDEFGVLLRGCSLAQALQVAEALRAELQAFRFAWQERLFVVGASIGAVAIAGNGDSPADILGAADAACYSAKDKGRNRVQAYVSDDMELLQRRGEMQWVSRITDACEKDRLRLYCQRILPLEAADGEPEHYEVLVRMLDEEGKLVPPMSFIPAAERYNLMPGIDRQIITMAFSFYAGVRFERLPRLSINLSGASLSDEEMLGFIQEQFRRYRVPPELICFEITETAAIANLARARIFIRELKDLGCRFSLDDFGSGLSSFAYLKNLPVDFLKIDGSFVKELANDSIGCAMVKAINDIGHVMGLQTIAEWVENDATLGILKAIGVNHAQGYAIEKPKPIEAIVWTPPGRGARDTADAQAATFSDQ